MGCLVPVCILDASCAKTNAEPTASGKSCSATVASLGVTNMCPTAPVKFHVSVADCENSSGTFEYEYMLVSEGQKVNVHASGAWTAAQKEADQVQNVPESCSNEIDDVDNVRVTSCTCAN